MSGDLALGDNARETNCTQLQILEVQRSTQHRMIQAFLKQ